MCKLCTLLQTVAGAGILGGAGIAIPGGFSTALTGLTSSPLASAAQATLGGGLSAVTAAIGTAPSFLTSMIPNNLYSLVPAGIPGISQNNLFGSLINQGSSLLSNGPAGFSSLITQSVGSAYSTANFKGLLDQYTNIDPSKDFGFNFKDPLSFVTNGISSDFSLGTASFGQLTNDLKGRLGEMFDVKNLVSLDDPKSLVQNLLDKGQDKLGSILSGQGIDISNLASVNNKDLLAAMEKVTGTDLKEITRSMGFNPSSPDLIGKLTDVLDMKKVFSAEGTAAAGGSFAALSRKLGNTDIANADFSDFADLGNFLGSVKTTQTNILDQLNNFKSSGVTAAFTAALAKMPEGSAAFGSPTIDDFLGSVSGQPYSNSCSLIGPLQTKIANSILGQNLLTAIQAAQSVDQGTDPGGVNAAAQISAAASALVNSGNAELQADLATGNSQFGNLFNNLLKEKNNLKKIGFDPSSVPTGSVDEVLGFTASLSNIHEDDFDQGAERFVRSVSTSDFAGQAITASIDEGYNHKIMQQRGIPINTKFDPAEYYKKKKSGQG